MTHIVLDGQFVQRARQRMDEAIRCRADELRQKMLAGLFDSVVWRIRCEARDPFFPREQPDD